VQGGDVTDIATRVLAGGQQFSHHTDRSGRGVNPAEESWVSVAHGVGEDVVREGAQEVLGGDGVLAELGSGETVADLIGHHPEHWGPANSFEVVGTELVYRKQIRPVTQVGAVAMDEIFTRSAGR
jgi:hypothetical protein